MELKIIEGVRVEPGDTLVLVLPFVLSQDAEAYLQKQVQKLGLKALLLPPGTRVYAKAVDAS